MKWIDSEEIAIALRKISGRRSAHCPVYRSRRWVCELENFSDDPNRSGERILEAIQMAWIDEVS